MEEKGGIGRKGKEVGNGRQWKRGRINEN